MRFNYQARTKQGEIQTGIVEAGNRETAVDTLQRHDLVVVFLEKISEVPFYVRSLEFFQRIKTKDVVIFYRQLAILFEANVSPLDSLKILGQQVKNPLFRDLIFELEEDIKGGEPLSQAMNKHPKAFSQFYTNVVKAGEATGKLSEVLKYLADHAEKEYNLTHKIKGAFIYPITIFTLFIIVAILMMIFVVPQLASMLEELNQELPFTTRVLIGTSEFLKNWIWLILIILIILTIVLAKLAKKEKGRLIVDTIKLKIPVLGLLFQKIYLARFSESLKTLLIGGLPILKALDITADVIGNKVYEGIIKEAREKVKGGDHISSALANYPKQITPMVTQMIGVGEQTGELNNILEKVVSFYQQEVDRTVANLTQLIEPAMILILGAGVGILISSILMPIYNIASGL